MNVAVLYESRTGNTARVARGRPTAGFVTYAVHAGNVLSKLEQVVEERGGEWIGGRMFKRGRLSDGVGAFVTAAFDSVGAQAQT